MKFRNDFVTNSSSSSFIAVFGTEVNSVEANQSKMLDTYKDNIFTGKYLKENWDELKREFTSEWWGVDPFIDQDEVEDDKLYFAYWSSEELTEDEDHNCGDGYDQDEVDGHHISVDNHLKDLIGFELEFASWEGRDG